MKKYLVALFMLAGCTGERLHNNDCIILYKESGLPPGWYKIIELQKNEYGYTARLQNLIFEANFGVFFDDSELIAKLLSNLLKIRKRK